jgi:hypothetical protein
VTAIRDRNGNLVILQYENPGSLGTVGDTATHRLCSVIDPLGRVATLTYPIAVNPPPSGTCTSYQLWIGGITTISYAGKTYQMYSQLLGTLSEVSF